MLKNGKKIRHETKLIFIFYVCVRVSGGVRVLRVPAVPRGRGRGVRAGVRGGGRGGQPGRLPRVPRRA